MTQDDIDYFRVRERQELLAADQAIDACCRMIHLEMARLYALRATELEANGLDVTDGESISAPFGQIIS